MMIPTTSASVNVADLDLTLAYRIEAMLADPRMHGYRVVSGVRTEAQQRYLYDGWRAGKRGFNLAADPDRVLATAFDGLVVRGSYHMQQSDGFGHAVDLRRPWNHSKDKAAALIGMVGAEYGLRQVALHAGGIRNNEWWHLQARNRYEWFPGPFASEGDEQMIGLGQDTDTEQWWVAVAGEGSTPVTEPAHWLSVVTEYRKTGIVKSAWLDTLIFKIRAERAGHDPQELGKALADELARRLK